MPPARTAPSRPRTRHALSLAATVALATALPAAARHAVEAVGYQPGTGFATDFVTGAGYTNVAAALGEPSRSTPGEFGGPVDPFSPPYLASQLLSIGAGGTVTLRLDQPARNDPANPFGIDLLLFGATGFLIINGDYSGGGITDGSLFGSDEATFRLSVSADGSAFHRLAGPDVPGFEGLFPTDGSGDFTLPVDPAFGADAFDNAGLGEIRLRYAGSGGGTGFDLAWAVDDGGNPVAVDEAAWLRLDVLSGRVDLDAVSAVRAVPEPSAWTLGLLGTGLVWRLGRGRRP